MAATQQPAQHPRTDKTGNSIWISVNKAVNFYVDLALKMMVTNELVELHGLGNAIEQTIETAELLKQHNRATINKLYTNTVDQAVQNLGTKPELLIELKRTGM